MRRFKKAISTAMAVCMVMTCMSTAAFAEEANPSGGSTGSDLSYDGYTQVWADEFEGDSLDRDSWNVELHEKGWVNSELQAYVDSEDNIKVQDGNLIISPVKTVETITTSGAEEQFTNTDFSEGMTGWTSTEASWSAAEFTYAAKDGAIVYDIDNVGAEDWCVQFKRENTSLTAGTTYRVSYNITSTVERPIVSGVMTADYKPYGEVQPTIGTETTKVEFEFTPAQDDDTAVFYITMGKVIGVDDELATTKHMVTISDLSMVSVVTEEQFTNTDFSEGMTGWTSTEASWSAAEFTYAAKDGAIVYDIDNVGAEDWCVQFKRENTSLTAGTTYHVSYNITSTVERPIVSGVMTADYKPYSEVKPTIGTETTKVTFDFTPSDDDDTAVFYITMGKVSGVDEELATTEHTITISDLSMTTTATTPPTTKEKVSYTSGRISTQNLQTFTYGLFEVRAKVPEGAGYLPAFWLMANDENVYGQWPRCGEIDCMEVMGQDPSKLYGTIHFGNPHSESQGTYINEENDFASDFHTFACEWEPGSIKWYVDGILYHSENDWYSTTEGQGTLSYPAPFDQPFYIILNLAVGGSWVGNPDEHTFDQNNDYVIDYVRVYQKDEYDENVQAPEHTFNEREPGEDGNFIVNSDFSDASEDFTDASAWKFMTALEGDATAAITNGQLVIDTVSEGTVDYSVQLVQADIPFEKGATYEIKFDAMASEARTMNVDIKAPDHGYAAYMPTFKPELTTEMQTFTTTFVMKSTSDENGRLEFNMGKMGSEATIYLDNVSVKKIADPDPNAVEEKTVLSNGNYIYNGSFQEGTGHLGYWDVDGDVKVTGFDDGRRLESTGTTVISQDALAFLEGAPYEFTMSAKAEEGAAITVTIGGNEYALDLVTDGKAHAYSIKLPSTTEYADKDISVKLEGTVSIDDLMLCEAALIKNGAFDAGLTNFEVYIDSSASASKVVDSLQEDNALSITINDTGDADWKVQVKQNNVPLENGKTYKLKFDAKSSLDRNIRVVMQGLEPLGWPVYSTDPEIKLTSEFQTFEETFTMTADTDEAAFFSICLGNVTEQITEQHVVVIDNISLEEVIEEEPVTGWVNEDGKWYYYNSDGEMVTGWVQDGNTWYYMNSDGEMATGWVQASGKWYYMNRSGAMVTGWVQVGSTWYYMSPSGAMATGWVQVGSTWYYFKPTGAMATGWVQVGSTWYYMKADGSMATGWVQSGSTWYYMKADGSMATGWLQIGSSWYYMDNSGAMVAGRWVEGKYYMNADGTMATNAWVDGGRYYVNASGVYVAGMKR